MRLPLLCKTKICVFITTVAREMRNLRRGLRAHAQYTAVAAIWQSTTRLRLIDGVLMKCLGIENGRPRRVVNAYSLELDVYTCVQAIVFV